MPGAAHETLVEVLKQQPELLNALLVALGRPALPTAMTAQDTAIRVTNPLEVRPDVLLVTEEPIGPWALLEVQRKRDEAKRRRWLAASGVLFDARKTMGDVVIFTHSVSVAQWAASVAQVVGPSGTRLGLWPVVILLTETEAVRLLVTGRPELAVFAAWAVHDRRGRKARAVVEKTLACVETAEPALRDMAIRAMLSMLGEPLLAMIREKYMKPWAFPESEGFKKIRMELEAYAEVRGETRGRLEGEAEALLTVLAARGFALGEATRACVLGCHDPAQLKTWLQRAATVATLGEVFHGAV